MDPIAAISLVTTAIETAIKVAPILIEGIKDLKTFGVALYEKYTGTAITPENRLLLETRIDELHTEFQKPIPAEEDQ